MLISVNQLKKGECGIIRNINLDVLPIKLLELGCLPDSKIQVLEIAPFGDPIYLNINGSFIAIRKEIAQHIIIEKTQQSNEV